MASANAGISGSTRYANCYVKLKMKITELFTRFVGVPWLSLATTNQKRRLLRMATQRLQQRSKNLPIGFEAEKVPAARMQALYDAPVDADRSAPRWPGFVHISMITWNNKSEISRLPCHGVPLALREGLLTTFVSIKYRSGSSAVFLSSRSAFRVRDRGNRLNRSSLKIPVFTRRTTEKLYVCDFQTQSVSTSSRICDIDENYHVQYAK